MKLVVLENRPWVIRDMVKKVKECEADEVLVLYYRDGTRNDERIEQIKAEYEEEQVRWEEIDALCFNKKMDELFEDKQRVFLFDLELNDKAEYFEERINVQYATNRFEQGDKRIWFYTTSSDYDIDKINKEFENHNISVLDYLSNEDKIVFDISEIEKMFCEQPEKELDEI